MLCAISAVAGMTPMLTAPHEANACSGAGQTYAREKAPKIEDAEGTERDLIIAVPELLQTFGGVSSNASGAHLEKADGTAVAVSRNDYATPGPSGNFRRALVPTTPLEANADYVLVVDGVAVGTDGFAPAQTVRVPFKTGEKLHAALPTPTITGEKARALSENISVGGICCGQSADYMPGSCGSPGKGTPSSCASTQVSVHEVVTVGWAPGATSWGVGVSFEARVTYTPEVPGKSGETTLPLSVPPIGEANPFGVPIAKDGKTCVSVVVRDRDTGLEKATEKACFDAGPSIPPIRTNCEALIPLVTSTKSKAGCLANAELLALLKDCPESPTNGGAGGTTSAGGSSAGGSSAGGSSVGGSSAGGSSAGGSSPTAGSGGGGGSSAVTPNPTPASDGGCSLGTLARSDGAAALAPIFAALAGIWVARRRQARRGFGT